MNVRLLVSEDAYPLLRICNEYYDLQNGYLFHVWLISNQESSLAIGVSVILDFGNGNQLPGMIASIHQTAIDERQWQACLTVCCPLGYHCMDVETRYFVQEKPAKIIQALTHHIAASWSLQLCEAAHQVSQLDLFIQDQESTWETILKLLQYYEWGQQFYVSKHTIAWRVGDLSLLSVANPMMELKIGPAKWGAQFGPHAHSVELDLDSRLYFQADQLYWLVGNRVRFDKEVYTIVSIQYAQSQQDCQATFTAILEKNLHQYYPSKEPGKPDWVFATVEGDSEQIAVDESGHYRIAMQVDNWPKPKGHRSPIVPRLQPFLSEEGGLHWPLHDGTQVLGAFCEDTTIPIIVGSFLSICHSPEVTIENSNAYAFTAPEGTHLTLDEAEAWLQFGTPFSKQRIAFMQSDMLIETNVGNILKMVDQNYCVETANAISWEAGAVLKCESGQACHIKSAKTNYRADTIQWIATDSIHWQVKDTFNWHIQETADFSTKTLQWKAQTLSWEVKLNYQLETKSAFLMSQNKIFLSSNGSSINMGNHMLSFQGTRCQLQAPLIEIRPGCVTAIKVSP